jgi:hypothetical protein
MSPTIALGSSGPLTEMLRRIFVGGNGLKARRAEDLIAIYERIV